jgi:hypothetical protein
VALPAGAYGQPPPPDWLDQLRPVPAMALGPPPGGEPSHASEGPAPEGFGLDREEPEQDKPAPAPDHQNPTARKGTKQS